MVTPAAMRRLAVAARSVASRATSSAMVFGAQHLGGIGGLDGDHPLTGGTQ